MDLTLLAESNAVRQFTYNLNAKIPLTAFYHRHTDDDSWFDMHYAIELGIICTGEMERSFAGTKRTFKPGEIWMHPMWEPHGFFVRSFPCEVLVFEIHPDFLNQKLFNNNWMLPFQVGPESRPQATSNYEKKAILTIAEQIKHQLDSREPSAMILWLQTAFFHLLANLLENWKPPKDISKHNHSNEVIEAFTLVFSKKRLITLEEAAQACGLSKRSFSQKFNALMGISFAQFALQYRVRNAKLEIETTNKTMEAVAIDWGFTDASHLSRHIRS